MDYCCLTQFLHAASSPKCKVFSIGESVLKKDIYAVTYMVNPSAPWALIVGGMHAREHLSCDLICMQIADLIGGKVKSDCNVCFVPLANPDGADLCLHGTEGLPKELANKLLRINGIEDFSLYKANANGVDLNNNFDANFIRKFGGKTMPCSGGYYGIKPFSEPESLALAQFTINLAPFMTVSYHLKGEEIYFDFFQPSARYCRDKRIAEVFANCTGYKIVSTQAVSSGGYKDWCVQKLGIPALTIELGADRFSHPFPHHQLQQIYNKNKSIFDCINKANKIVRSTSVVYQPE